MHDEITPTCYNEAIVNNDPPTRSLRMRIDLFVTAEDIHGRCSLKPGPSADRWENLMGQGYSYESPFFSLGGGDFHPLLFQKVSPLFVKRS
ncbi:hypothetical protein CEXT_126261 [Caerostris extrusa]|uniref:Uncharacterized protein n=1 Tax=Caerostris extrusa TaxID=172846 RepID=A0AAV4XDZ4_CAEEX|nr:hypothetical protein CEXT_126261 [Caerostris extrusa]